MTLAAPFVPIEYVTGILARFGKSMTFTPYSQYVDNISGDEVLTAGSPQTVTAAFLQKNQAFEQGKEGLFSLGDGYVVFAASVNPTPKKNDQVTVDGDTYRIENTLQRYADATNTTLIYTLAVVTLLT